MDEQQKPSPLQSFSPKQIFLFGAVGAILVLCTIGFFILLGLLFSAEGISFGENDDGGTIPAGTDVNGRDQAPTKITVRAVDTKSDHIRGDKNADITIVEYSDLECPFCKNFHNTMKQVLDANAGEVRWVYRHFPLDSLHSQARREAHASECASEQGKFWEFIDLVFQETKSNDGLDLTKLPDYAKRLNLDVNQFNACVNSEKYASRIQSDETDAQTAGARGTPYSVILGPKGQTIPISGALPLSQIKSMIDSIQ